MVVMLLTLALAGGFLGAHVKAHQQDWHCLGPQPSFAGTCSSSGYVPQPATVRRSVEPAGARPHVSDGNPQAVSDLVRQSLGER